MNAEPIQGLSETQLVKVVLTLSRVAACKEFVSTAAGEVVNKMSTIAAPQLLLLTQGMASLGSSDASLMKVAMFQDTHWERCFVVHYVHGQKQTKQEPEWHQRSYSHWEGGGDWGQAQRAPTRSASGKRGGTPKGNTPRQAPRQNSRKPKGKGKGKKEPNPLSTPFSMPWPTSDTSFSSAAVTSPFTQLAPLPPPTTPPPQTAIVMQENTPLVIAVKEEYPDLSKAPTNIRVAVEKAEATNPSRIASDLHRMAHKMKKATERMRELKEQQIRHKTSWQKHLNEALACWESQIKTYMAQQKSYSDLMEKSRQELQTARKDIQRLNHLAAGTGTAPAIVNLVEPEVITVDDTENLVLMERMQSTLHQCAQLFMHTDEEDTNNVVMVPSEDEAPAAKRQRSAEPGVGTVPSPQLLLEVVLLHDCGRRGLGSLRDQQPCAINLLFKEATMS
eukprot:s334_g11.t1